MHRIWCLSGYWGALSELSFAGK